MARPKKIKDEEIKSNKIEEFFEQGQDLSKEDEEQSKLSLGEELMKNVVVPEGEGQMFESGGFQGSSSLPKDVTDIGEPDVEDEQGCCKNCVSCKCENPFLEVDECETSFELSKSVVEKKGIYQKILDEVDQKKSLLNSGAILKFNIAHGESIESIVGLINKKGYQCKLTRVGQKYVDKQLKVWKK